MPSQLSAARPGTPAGSAPGPRPQNAAPDDHPYPRHGLGEGAGDRAPRRRAGLGQGACARACRLASRSAAAAGPVDERGVDTARITCPPRCAHLAARCSRPGADQGERLIRKSGRSCADDLDKKQTMIRRPDLTEGGSRSKSTRTGPVQKKKKKKGAAASQRTLRRGERRPARGGRGRGERKKGRRRRGGEGGRGG